MPKDYHAAKRDILQSMPGTQKEITARSGWSFDTVDRWIRRMRAAKECHVGAWNPPTSTGPSSRVHYAGKGTDVKCPYKPLTNAEISRNYRNRWMAHVFHPPGKEAATKAEP